MRIKTLGLALFATAAALLLATASLADNHVLRIGTEGAYPPFNMMDADGNLIGFDVDIAKALCEEMGVECTFVAQDWDGIIPGLVANKYDAIVASMSITPERAQTVAFTDKYYSNFLRFVVKKGSGIMGQGDLQGKTVGAQRATVSSQWTEDTLGRRANVRLYDTQTAAYSDLKAGRIDVLVSDVYPAHDWLQENPGYEFVGEPVDIEDRIGIAVRKGEDELRQRFNRAIKAIRQNGTYAEINEKYFPFDIY